ncbi:MAG: chemotaxis protein CheC [Anaerolineales bacterium]
MEANPESHSQLNAILTAMTKEGIRNAARGMSEMVGESLNVTDPNISVINFSQIPFLLGGPETEAVGIYLRIEGNIPGQIMLVLPYTKALELADLIMGEPVGTTQTLGKMERSALAELGNLTASFFLNAIADSTGVYVRPSPPAVIVDMVGAIMDIILATSDVLSDEVLMIQARFLRKGKEAQADLWIIPDHQTVNNLTEKASSKHE